MDGNKTKSLFYSAEEVIDMLGLGKTKGYGMYPSYIMQS